MQKPAMASAKKPEHLMLCTDSDEDGRKPLKSVEWPLKAVPILLDIYIKKFAAGRGYLRGKDWEEVMIKVNSECGALKTYKTVKQCRDKVDSLKRRYKMEKRKAVTGIEVTWPFFSKLDAMMGSVFKQAKGFEPYDIHQKYFHYYSHGEDEDDEDADNKHNSPQEGRGVKRRRHNSHYYMDILENGKAKAESFPGEGLNLLNHLTVMGPPSIDDNSGRKKQSRPIQAAATIKSQHRKRKVEVDNPMQALTDAIRGFSEVYARVELAKLEILTTMKLELAKLRIKRCKKHRRIKQSSSSSSSSG